MSGRFIKDDPLRSTAVDNWRLPEGKCLTYGWLAPIESVVAVIAVLVNVKKISYLPGGDPTTPGKNGASFEQLYQLVLIHYEFFFNLDELQKKNIPVYLGNNAESRIPSPGMP